MNTSIIFELTIQFLEKEGLLNYSSTKTIHNAAVYLGT